MFSKFLKLAIATSKFMNEVYNGGFSHEFSVSMLQEIIYVYINIYIIYIYKYIYIYIYIYIFIFA